MLISFIISSRLTSGFFIAENATLRNRLRILTHNQQINLIAMDKKRREPIWAYIEKCDRRRFLHEAIREKETLLTAIHKECGNCSLWMTPECFREKRTMVTRTAPVCGDFIQDKWAAKLSAQLPIDIKLAKTELAEINAWLESYWQSKRI